MNSNDLIQDQDGEGGIKPAKESSFEEIEERQAKLSSGQAPNSSGDRPEKKVKKNEQECHEEAVNLFKEYLDKSPSLVSLILGVEADEIKIEPLDTSGLRLEPPAKPPDFLIELLVPDFEGNKGKYLLHIEFIGHNQPKMEEHMMDYFMYYFVNSELNPKHDKDYLSFLVYMGDEEPNMETEYRNWNFSFKYRLINLLEYPELRFLEGADLEEYIFQIILKKVAPTFARLVLNFRNHSQINETLIEPSEAQKWLMYLRLLKPLNGLRRVIAEKIHLLKAHRAPEQITGITKEEETLEIKKIAIERGKDLGFEEMKIKFAKQALEEGIDPALISQFTGLSLEQIQRL
jgi:predicted transposase/invertase (TIGR01784 family)